MRTTRATHPMSHAAASAADDDFYDAHPEMVKDDGKRVPLDPHDPAQANLRHEWIEAYAANGGQVHKVTPAAQAAAVRQAAQQTETLPDDTVAPPPVLACSSNDSSGIGAKAGADAQKGPDPQIVATAPVPDKPPVPCKLRGATVHCEHHGRQPGKDGVLSVVPDGYGSIGDTITCVADVVGGCGDHIEWSISGMWTSTDHAATTTFHAKTFKPTILGWLALWKEDPQIYRASATMCEGGAPSYEIRAYPPDKIEIEWKLEALEEEIKGLIRKVPLSPTLLKKIEDSIKVSIKGSEQWKEVKHSPRAYCEGELEVSAGFEGETSPHPIYPLALIPPGLTYYIQLGCYYKISGEIGLKSSWAWKYWPDTEKWHYDKWEVALEGSVTGELGAGIFLMNPSVLKADIAGVTSLKVGAKPHMGDGPEIEMEWQWDPLSAVITIKGVFHYFDYEKTYPIFDARPKHPHKWVLHLLGGKSETRSLEGAA